MGYETVMVMMNQLCRTQCQRSGDWRRLERRLVIYIMVGRRACSGWDRATGRFHPGNSREATTGKCHRWKADRRRILSSEYAQVFVANGCDPPPSARAVEAPLDPGR